VPNIRLKPSLEPNNKKVVLSQGSTPRNAGHLCRKLAPNKHDAVNRKKKLKLGKHGEVVKKTNCQLSVND